ncbi:hypothetical protein EJV47_20460 [Hymenobacter gummosus]|uniref:Uncharacterized protein n=1 Tax=Hymenobacter gummosus TaxID=1776032 RepID=A0A431TY25_9BACT|nr:hypothetical protein [Hymenobacter gummosus]RTQ46750.1 hypothetical protein EJV47_20460 [Hymenobacter gummosus]
MTENDKGSQALATLTEALIGNFISGFRVGDWWCLYVGGYCLLAQEVVSADEPQLNQWYQTHYPPFADCVDKENISKTTVVAAHLRRIITEVALDNDYNLTLSFDNGRRLTLSTDTDIVDWQWALNETDNDPYISHIVACFGAGEISTTEDPE